MAAGAERTDLGYFRWTEATRKFELALVGDVLAAKHQHRMLLECRAHRRISGIVHTHLRKRHAAQFGGKPRTQRYDFHRVSSVIFIGLIFCQWQMFSKEAAAVCRKIEVLWKLKARSNFGRNGLRLDLVRIGRI